MKRKNICNYMLLLICLMLSLSPAFTAAAENSSPVPSDTEASVWITEEIEEFEMPAAETSALAISLFSDTGSGPYLAGGNHIKWIDRVVLPDYARSLYTVLESNLNNANGYLINPANADSFGSGYYGFIGREITETGLTVPGITKDSELTKAEFIDAVSEMMGGIKQQNILETAPNLLAAYNAFDRDHPEVFWITSHSMTGSSWSISIDYENKTFDYTQDILFILQHTESGSVQFDVRKPIYYDVDTILTDINVRDASIANIRNTITGTTRYEIIQQLNSWLTSHNEYNSYVGAGNTDGSSKYPLSWECLSALKGCSGVDGPVCEGYARAFMVLCKELGIPCVLVDGQARTYQGDDPEGHMWNYVQMDNGQWYAMDVTWNDNGIGSEEYLLKGSEATTNGLTFLQSHPVSNCVSSGGVSFTNGPKISVSDYILDPPVIMGIEDRDIFCEQAAFTVKGHQVTAVFVDDEEVSPSSEGVYTIFGDGDQHTITVENVLNDITTCTIKVNEAHSPEQHIENIMIDEENDLVTYEEVEACTSCLMELSRETMEEAYSANMIIDGVEDAGVYCEEVSFTVSGVTGLWIDEIDTELTDESYTISGDDEIHTVQVENEWGAGRIFTFTVNSGHTPGEAVRENEIPADLYTEGSYDEVVYCSICEIELSRRSEVIETITTTETTTEATTETTAEATTETTTQAVQQPETQQNQPVSLQTGTVLEDIASNGIFTVTNGASINPEVAYSGLVNKKASTVVIPETITENGISYRVTSISDKAFKNNKNLKKVTIGASITKIGKQAFFGCRNLKTITINSTRLTSGNVGSKAFKNINAKAVIKVPAKKYKEYKKLLKSKGVGSKVKIKKK